MTQDVIFQTLGTLSGKSIGVVTLNIEKALNALNIGMVQAMTKQLKQWQTDANIALVVLDGSGDKAFCAGGDVRAIYHASMANPNKMTDEACEFFTQEYQLDYLLHQFGKPVLVWGDGIVMGGGLGLMAGGSHRVLTERSRIAMPEITIGLYPDVGGSYFLNRMPGKIGLFLGLTAYNMNAADALYVNVGNHFLASDDKEPLFDALADVHWNDSTEVNHQALTQLLKVMQDNVSVEIGDSPLATFQQQIDLLMSGDIEDVHYQLSSLQTELDWLRRAQKSALAGSPLSWHLVFAQAQLGTELSLADCFRWELGISVNCCSHGDFCEGVRALLIDKDRNPQWRFNNVSQVSDDALAALLTSPWQAEHHPLKDF
ncbi:enoyl-CoA hydratase/isomerase family protein [Shewanella subflava]|uniref:3-hydroxyisobutyryl-CoA hydrolase n=1 Tax=Shewanella subflava TaxID=2986476 RepID=A0ABT3IDJ1_9GAMM|nr:enoyl-CoA hydratase/isomerase family protein [Shewanella subflava]MCW3174117.1 enoyl-CoA hydratase/isomerase family protein [Shewanella subflava]